MLKNLMIFLSVFNDFKSIQVSNDRRRKRTATDFSNEVPLLNKVNIYNIMFIIKTTNKNLKSILFVIKMIYIMINKENSTTNNVSCLSMIDPIDVGNSRPINAKNIINILNLLFCN